MTSRDTSTTRVRMRGPVSGQLLYWVGKVATRILAPGFHTMDGLLKAVRKNRVKGPAGPPSKLRRKWTVRETRHGGTLVFEVGAVDRTPRRHLLYLHGGAFVMDMQVIQWALVDGLLGAIDDADLWLPIYPLGPEATWRETMEVVAAIFREMAEEYGPENVVVTGDSAGGALALLLAQHLRDRGEPLPAALVLFSPVTDLTASGQDQPDLEKRDPSISINLVRNCARLWAPDLEPDDPRISPLFASQEGLPPTLLFTGDREVLESDALRLVERNPSVDHRSYAEMGHVFPIGGTREGPHAMRETAAFLESLEALP